MGRRVTFRFRAPHPVPFAELRGDLVHWRHPHLMDARGGVFTTTVALDPGVYAYKFRLADGTWCFDPDNPRTRGDGGVRNSVVVVDGAVEPVLHAPAPPWLWRVDDGRLCVRAGLRHGHGGLALVWDEGAGARRAPMTAVADEDEHALFEVWLPASARRLDYWFELDDGRRVGAAGGGAQALSAPVGAAPKRPAWWRRAVLYTVFVDRFRRAGGDWPAAGAGVERVGGDLDGVREALPYLADVGVDALHLTPICVAPSAHRYDLVDPRRVDPAIGGDAALRRLLDAAHARGMRVIMDLTVTHVHRDFPQFVDVRERGPASPYWGWFQGQRFPFGEGVEPGYRHYQKGQWHLPLLATDHPEVVEYLVDTFVHWARFGVDGFRVDAAADVPLALVRAICRAVRSAHPDAVVFGEVIADGLARWTTELDAATDFVAQQTLYDWLWRGTIDGGEVARRAARRAFLRPGPGHREIGFVGTHDQPRLRTLAGPEAARLGLLWTLLGSAVPALYYGDEVGLRGDEDASARSFEDAWPDRAPMRWAGGVPEGDAATLALVRAAIRLRREAPGEVAYAALGQPDVVAFTRGPLAVYLHRGAGTVRLPVDGALRLACGDAQVVDGALVLGPRSGAVLRRPDPARDAWQALLAEATRLGGLAWHAGEVEIPSLPRNLYLTLTERCNLRCRHCITHAPAKTRDGTGRAAQPWLLHALRDAFAAARYVGFAHGGESLVAPQFWPALAAIARAPGARDVHLLSNGVLLDADTVSRLVDHGVNSLAVSLDGATRATNDAIRLGGDFDRIVAQVRAAAARDDDLRVGVSFVLADRNLAELPALGALVADLGVDWLKVEEMFPANPFARHALLGPADPRVRDAMAALAATCAAAGVVLVDHLAPPGGCRCDPRSAAFRAADDFANRATFNPCRVAWEQACVDPDGTVHAVDYFAPALGSLAEQDFIDLWNGEAAARVRRGALATTPAGRRARCTHLLEAP